MAISTATTQPKTATSPKPGQGHPYKEMYSRSRRTALPPGADAPDFTLRSTPDQWLTLSEFRGQPVVLAFYPADWSPVCGDQVALYNEMLKEFHELGAELIRHFGGWRVVPRRIRARSQASFPPSGRL